MTYPHTGTLQRNTSNGGKFTFTSIGTTPCFLQPLDDTVSQTMGIAFSKGSKCYVPETLDVLESDRISINGTKYGIKGLKNYQFGTLAHKMLILEQLS